MQNKLKNRREFFKEAARKSLPILGMAIMTVAASTVLQSCTKDCLNGCMGSCSNSCSGGCKAQCKNGCGKSSNYGY